MCVCTQRVDMNVSCQVSGVDKHVDKDTVYTLLACFHNLLCFQS